MNREELENNMREMVAFILPEDCRNDKDIVQNYTDTMVMIAEEYKNDFLIEISKKVL